MFGHFSFFPVNRFVLDFEIKEKKYHKLNKTLRTRRKNCICIIFHKATTVAASMIYFLRRWYNLNFQSFRKRVFFNAVAVLIFVFTSVWLTLNNVWCQYLLHLSCTINISSMFLYFYNRERQRRLIYGFKMVYDLKYVILVIKKHWRVVVAFIIHLSLESYIVL